MIDREDFDQALLMYRLGRVFVWRICHCDRFVNTRLIYSLLQKVALEGHITVANEEKQNKMSHESNKMNVGRANTRISQAPRL